MKLAIVTHVKHKVINDYVYAYAPYVREIDLWSNNASQTKIVAPIIDVPPNEIESNFRAKIELVETPSFNITDVKNILLSIINIPIIILKLFKTFYWSDHIHIRCPGNMGLLGVIVQLFFPSKSKTIKYAGNWDPKSKQPRSYRLQKWIVSNTFLTKNCKVLVYGKWRNQSNNIVPFFTASYFENEIKNVDVLPFKDPIKFVYVGALSKGKQPILAIKTIESLNSLGYNIKLDLYGDGEERQSIVNYIKQYKLEKIITLHGNVNKDKIKVAYQSSHFLVFISKSEGWPKVVAEAMFWSCLPIASKVSCVPSMLGEGKRGAIIDSNSNIIEEIENYLKDFNLYKQHVINAKNWSQKYTLEKFQLEIERILNG